MDDSPQQSPASEPAVAPAAPPVEPAGELGFRPTRDHVRGRALPLRVLGLFSSMKAAAVQIAVIATVIGVATYYERSYGQEAVTLKVYHAWWFQALWALIGLNIFGAAAVRYPWKRRQIGFVVVHVGLLTLMAGFWLSAGRLDGLLEVGTGAESSEIRTSRDRLTVVDGDGAGALRKGVSFGSTELTGLPSFFRFCGALIKEVPPPGIRTGDPLAVLLSPDEYDQRRRGAVAVPDGFPRITITGAVLWGDRELVYVPGDVGDPFAVRVALRVKPPTPGAEEMVMGDVWLRENGERESEIGPARFALGRTRSRLLAEDLVRPREELPSEPTLVLYHQGKRFAVPAVVGPVQELSPTCSLEIQQAIEHPVFDGKSLVENPAATIDPLLVVQIGEGPVDARVSRMSVVFAYHPAALAVLPEAADGAELIYEHPTLREGGAGQGVNAAVIETPDAALFTAFSRTRGRLSGGHLEAGVPKDWTVVGGTGGPMQATATVTWMPHARQGPRPIVVTGANAPNATRWLEVEATRGKASGRTWIARSDGGEGVARIQLDDGSGVLLRYDPDVYDLKAKHGFSVRLERFIEQRDPGGESVSGYASDLLIVPADPADGEPISRRMQMNEPVTFGGATLYQTSFIPARDHNGQPIPGRYLASVFTAATDPGRICKYAGSAILVAGMILLYLLNRRVPVTRSS